MKRFLLTALISVISAYAILAAADFRLSGRLKESHGLVAVWSEILDGGLDADIVIMGASDAAYGISPAILDSILPGTKTYNLGCEGRFVLSQVAKYNTYLKRNRPPSVAVYSLTHMTLLSEQYYERSQYFPFFFIRAFREAVFPLDSFSAAERFIPMLRYRGGVPQRLSKTSRSLTNGFGMVDRPFSRREMEEAAITLNTPFYIPERSERAFLAYLDSCRALGIRVVFVYPPVYREIRDITLDREEMYSFFESIASPRGIPVIDYSYHPMCNDSSLFFDGAHLNKTGSEIYSRILAGDLKRQLYDESIGNNPRP